MERVYLSFFFLLCIIYVSEGQGTDSSLPWYVWLILAVGLAVGLILIGLICFYVLNVCKKVFGNRQPVYTTDWPRREPVSTNTNSKETVDAKLNTIANETMMPPHDKEISRDKIRILQQLGIGEYGPLLDAEVQLDVNVKSRALIKVFQKGTSQDLAMYKYELEKFEKLGHANVVQLFGVVSQSPYYTVLELPVNGDLKTFLLSSNKTSNKLTMTQLMAMATDAASGLAYLESTQYIHRDIAARNCVVTQTLGIKISDYNVSRYLFRSEYAVQADGSLMAVRWLAPESLLENHFSLQSDIWSFGVLLWEILTTGQFPFAELSDSEVVQGVCYEFQRLLQPVLCPSEVYQLMLKCWHSNPAQRPRMEYLHSQLESCIIRGPSTVETHFADEPTHGSSDPGIPANPLPDLY